MLKKKRGFTLVEIMIVVAIIALLATIAIPGIIRSRVTANESNAIATLKSIAAASETYRAAQTTGVYPTALDNLTNATPPYITGFTSGVKAGYNFSVAGDADSFSAVANPTTLNTTGTRYFCIDQTGNVEALASSGTASASADCNGTIISQ